MITFSAIRGFIGKPIIGDGQCVTFVRYVTDLPPTLEWVKGLALFDENGVPASNILPGTAVGTFDDKGQFQHEPTGQHTGFFLRFEIRKINGVAILGIVIVEQYRSVLLIQERWIPMRPIVMLPNGMAKNASNIAQCYSVIELRATP